jgi:GNAT superfamily N-acetyltransferase
VNTGFTAPRVRLRAATADDADFLYTLSDLTLRPHLESLGKRWSVAGMRAKCDADAMLPGQRIVQVDGADCGSFCTEPADGALWLRALILLSAWQRQGIGAQLMQQVLDRGRALGVPVRLHVVRTNPARAFYERAGFEVEAEDDVHLTMRWQP